MPLTATGVGGGADFEPLPAGPHISRCISVVDFGWQETTYGPKQKVYLGFEVPSVRVEWEKDGVKHEGAALIGSTYTNSVHPKSVLGQHLVNWRGKAFTEEELEGFDLFTIVGVPCMISVTHNIKGQKTYANVSGIMGLPPGVEPPIVEATLLRYSALDPATANTFDSLPNWMKQKCNSAVNPPVKETPATAPPADDGFDDDIPF